MQVEIWSDVVCPWCAIGKRRFETAPAGFEHADDVEVVWRSFELDPTAPKEATGSATRRQAYADRQGTATGVAGTASRVLTFGGRSWSCTSATPTRSPPTRRCAGSPTSPCGAAQP